MKRPLAILATSALVLGVLAAPAVAQSPSAAPGFVSGQPIVLGIPGTFVSPEATTADTPVDTAPFKKDAPWKLCVSAGYLANSWVVFALQSIRYQASLEAGYEPDIVVTDAGFDANKQIGDIADLVNQGCEAIIYWPVDDKAIEPGLQAAVEAGIPTVNVGGGYTDVAAVVSNAHIDQYQLGVATALKLVEALGGEGKIVSMLPIAGTTAAVNQDKALRDVIADHPGIEILDTQNGDWNRAKAKTITENWLTQYGEIDGVFSPAGQMSVGMAEAFDEAGRLGEVTFSPGDEYNGWLKWIAAHPESNGGVVTFPPTAGGVGVQQMTRILRGEEVTKGIQVPSTWYSPEDAAALADAEAPDDWWATDLPPEFLPQS
jgi:ABC-type sugar transport system substrate-binding protein